MQGDGSTVEVLKEAGANRADVIVAATGNDEDNLVICQVAKVDVSSSSDHRTGEQSTE